jgi:hypothetical protein
MRKGGLALIAILLLGSVTKLIVPQNPAPPSGPESKPAGTPAKVAAQPQKSDLENAQESVEWYPTQLREKIRDYFGVEKGPELDPVEGKVKLQLDPQVKNAGDLKLVCKSLESWCAPPGAGAGIQFVIATIPDPVHTHLGLFFDRAIDAIEQGATSQKYLFDRSVMPWQYFIEPSNQETEEDKLLRKVRESYPGLMIFRGPATTEPLFVFVVGETPTAGINKEQFHNAIEMIHEIREGKNSVKSGQAVDFRILGPMLSGSLVSLQIVLEDYFHVYWNTPGNQAPVLPVYAVVMGTDAIKAFSEAPLPHVKLAIFMEDGKSALNALLNHVCSLGYTGRDVAILNEDDTSYGNFLQKEDPKENPCYKETFTITFPRGISQFRSAYSKDPQIQNQATDPNQPQRRTLRLDLRVTGSDDDNVAPYATAQTALSQEAIMLAIVSELRRSDSKFILIRATDPLDELFLTRYLSSAYPDARLVVPTPDLLFAREEGGVVDGTLGLNTYPVSPANLNQLCPSVAKTQPAFPAASGVGLFNATVALLEGLTSAGARPTVENGKTVESFSAEQQPCGLSPNLWLTIVNRNSVNAIQVLTSNASPFFPASGKDRPEEHEHDRRSGRIQLPWAILCVLCLALLANHIVHLRTRNALGIWGTVKSSGASEKFWKGKDWILWLGAVVLVGMPVIFASSVIPITHPEHGLGTWFIAIFLGLSWIGFTAFVTMDFCKTRNKPILAVSFCVLSIGFMAVGVAFAWWKSTEMVLWQQRNLDLASQVSPATPLLLLLAAFYTWLWFSLKAEALIDWRSPRLPDSQGLPAAHHRMTESEAEGIRMVIPSFAPPRRVLFGALVIPGLIAIRGMMVGPHGIPIRSLEGISYDVIYSLGVGIAMVLLIATLLRIVAVWEKMQPMLSSLNRPGMKQALDRLKGFEWHAIWNPLESMQDEARKLYSKEIHVVERFAESLGKTNDPANPDALQPLRTSCKEILDRWEKISRILFEDIPNQKADFKDIIIPLKEIQEKLAQTAKALWKDFLDPSWKALPADDGNEMPPEKTQDSPGPMTVKAAITESVDSPRIKFINAEIEKKGTAETPGQSHLSAKSLLLAEELVACVYATFITVVLLRIRGLVFSAVVIYTALVFSSISYPFQPPASLRNLALLLFLLGAIVVGYVYEEMHRDPTLRNMTSTDPNKVDAAFWFKLVSAGLLPLLGLLTALFPQVGHFLYTIAAPILHSTQ